MDKKYTFCLTCSSHLNRGGGGKGWLQGQFCCVHRVLTYPTVTHKHPISSRAPSNFNQLVLTQP